MIALGSAYDPSRSPSNHAAVHAAIVDTKTAIRWVRANADRYGFDPQRVVAVGSSAGGFCAVVAGITDADALDTDLPSQTIVAANHPGEDAGLQAIVNLWGGAGPWLDDLDAEDPPMMHVYGTDDWLYPEGLALRDRCTEIGAACEWVPLDGSGHGAWNAPIDGMSREEAILGFFQRHGLLDPQGLPDADQAESQPAAIPWGAMYVPNAELQEIGMTGVIKAYRGESGARKLLEDLRFAAEREIQLILTLGSVAPADYLDTEGNLLLGRVEREMAPFVVIAEEIRPYIEGGTVWGIRFLDEPHDPAGAARGWSVDPQQLGAAFDWIQQALGPVRLASTSPPWYMSQVPGAAFAFGQCVHGRLPQSYPDTTAFHREQSAQAHTHGLLYVASLNANTNAIDNLTFFTSYREMCALETVDFVTAWQWPRGHHPHPSVSERFADPDPAVQALIRSIPEACGR
jgi:predicted esterase